MMLSHLQEFTAQVYETGSKPVSVSTINDLANVYMRGPLYTQRRIIVLCLRHKRFSLLKYTMKTLQMTQSLLLTKDFTFTIQ